MAHNLLKEKNPDESTSKGLFKPFHLTTTSHSPQFSWGRANGSKYIWNCMKQEIQIQVPHFCFCMSEPYENNQNTLEATGEFLTQRFPGFFSWLPSSHNWILQWAADTIISGPWGTSVLAPGNHSITKLYSKLIQEKEHPPFQHAFSNTACLMHLLCDRKEKCP